MPNFGKGFLISNLENFRKFYLTFPPDQNSYALRRNLKDQKVQQKKIVSQSQKPQPIAIQKSYALRRELSWTHYRLLMRVENVKARDYYMEEAIAQNWSTRALERQINSLYYERIISSKNKKEKVITEVKRATSLLPL